MIEAVLSNISRTIDGGQTTALNIGFIQQSILETLPTYLQFLRELGIHPPVWCFLTLMKMKSLTILRSGHIDQPPIDREILYLPEAMIDDLSTDALTPLKPLFDMVWNAAGWDESLNATPNGSSGPWKRR